MKTLWLALMAGASLLAAQAGAFSFLPGGFAPGEKITDIQLSAGASGPTVTFDTISNGLVISASVSRIDTTLASYTPLTLGDVIFSSQLSLVAGTEVALAPSPPFFGGLATGEFRNGVVADITLVDAGPGGSGLLLAADYSANLVFNATGPAGFGLPVTGSLNGGFTRINGAGDAGFEAAFGSAGNYFANLTNFTSNGIPVTTDLCVLLTVPCITGLATIDSFTVNPTATVIPLATPEAPVWPLAAVLLPWLGRGLAGRPMSR